MIIKRTRGKKCSSKNFPANHLWHKNFWIALIVIMIVSFIVIFLNMDEKVTVTGKIIQPIAFMKAESFIDIEGKEISGLSQVRIEIMDTIKGGEIIIEEDNNIIFPGKAISKFTISSKNADKIGKLTFTLRLTEEELNKAKVDKEELSLFYMEEAMETNVEKIVGSYLYFSATAPSLGNFVIGKK